MFKYCPAIGKKWFSEVWCWIFWGISISAFFTSKLVTWLVGKIPAGFEILQSLLLFTYMAIIIFSFVIFLINFIKFKNCFTGPWDSLIF